MNHLEKIKKFANKQSIKYNEQRAFKFRDFPVQGDEKIEHCSHNEHADSIPNHIIRNNKRARKAGYPHYCKGVKYI